MQSFLNEIEKNPQQTFSNEEIFRILRNRLKNISNYENDINSMGNGLEKNILISHENEKQMEIGIYTKGFLAKTDRILIKPNANVSLEKSINENPMFGKILWFGLLIKFFIGVFLRERVKSIN